MKRKRRIARRKEGEKKRTNKYAYFFTSFILTVAAAASVAGIFVVDRNSRSIGWNEDNATLAFSSSAQSFHVKIMGHSFGVIKPDLHVVTAAVDGFNRGFIVIEPPPLRLLIELHVVCKPLVHELDKILANYL